MKRSRLQGIFLRAVTVLMMLVMLGSACLPTAALAITIPSEDSAKDITYATFGYSDGVFDIRLNADALYEMLADGSVTREELARFIPSEVLDLFVNGKPTLDQMKSVLAQYISKEDLKAMVADLPLDIVTQLFDIELLTGLFEVEELMDLIDLEALLADVDPELVMALLEGEPLDLLLKNEALWKQILDDDFIAGLLADENFLKLVDDPEVQTKLHNLLRDKSKVNFDALLSNPSFVKHVLENENVLPDLVAALAQEGHIAELFSEELLNRLSADGLLVVNADTVEKLIEIGAVKLDADTLSALDFSQLLNDSDKLQAILDELFEGEAGEIRAAELAAAIYGDTALLQRLELVVLTDLGIVRLDAVNIQQILEEISLDPLTDVFPYMSGSPSADAIAQTLLNLTGEEAVIDLPNFLKEFSSNGKVNFENIDLMEELLPRLEESPKQALIDRYKDRVDASAPAYMDQDRMKADLITKITQNAILPEDLALAEKVQNGTATYDELYALVEAYLTVEDYFLQEAYLRDLMDAVSVDEKRNELMAMAQRGDITINDLQAWGAFAWSDMTIDLLVDASDYAVNKTNLFAYIKSQIEAGAGLSGWVQALYESDKISMEKLKAWGVISLDAAGVREMLEYRDAEGNPMLAPSDLLGRPCVNGWLSDEDLMVDLFCRQVITTNDLRAWSLLDLRCVFTSFRTPAALENAGIITQQNLNRVILEYVGFNGIRDFLVGNAEKGIVGHPAAFSVAVDVLIAHLNDVWSDFVNDVDFAAVFPDKQAVAEAITYEKIIEHVGLPTLVQSAGGYGALLGNYENDELIAFFRAIGTDKLQKFATDAGLLEKLNPKALLADLVELAKSKPGLSEKLKDELSLRVAGLFGDKSTRLISINDHPIFVNDWDYAIEKYGAEYMDKNVATAGSFDLNRVLAVLISALPDINDFLSMGDDADLFSLVLNWDMTPDEDGEARSYSIGVKLGFIGSLEKLQGLVEPYRDRFVMEPSYEFAIDEMGEFLGSSVHLDVFAELPSVVGTAYESLLQVDDAELHEFLVELPNSTLAEIADFLSELSDNKVATLSEKLAARSGAIRDKLIEALTKAGGAGNAVSQKAEAILNKITTPGGLASMRNRIVSALKGQMGVLGNRTVDSFYNPEKGTFEIPYEREISLLDNINGFVQLPEEITLLFVDDMNITTYLDLSLKFANIHRMEVIRSNKTAALPNTLSELLDEEPVINTGVSSTILYSPDGAKPTIFYEEELYELNDMTHTALTAMPAENAVLIDSGVRSLAFDYQYEGSTDGTVTERLFYAVGYERTSIYKLPEPSDGVTLQNGYHYGWTLGGEEITNEAELYAAMESNAGHMTVKLLEKQPVITFNGTFEQASDKDGFLASFPYTPGEWSEELWNDMLAALNAQKGDSHNYESNFKALRAAIEKIVADAAANVGPYDQTVTVEYSLNLYQVIMNHKGQLFARYVYKHGTATLLDPVTLEEVTLVAPPRGYAWPTLDCSANADLSYDSYAIEYTIVIDGVSYTVTVETPMLDGKTAWESFLAANPTAPARPDAEDEDFEYYWVLESNGLRPSDDASGFILPADPDFDWSRDPAEALFVLKAGRTRTHGYLAFYNQNGEQIRAPYRYEIGKHNFDATGASYLEIPSNCKVNFYDEYGNVWDPAKLNTAPESGTYSLTVQFVLITKDQITIYGEFESLSGVADTYEIYVGEYAFVDAPDSYADLVEAILSVLDTKRENKFDYDRDAIKATLNEFFEKAFESTDPYSAQIQVKFNLKTYTVSLKHKGQTVAQYVYKHGSTELLDATTRQPITQLPTPTRGYAWPTIDGFSENKDLSYSSYAIRYRVVVGNDSYYVTVETEMREGKTAWESFRIATGAPASPAAKPDFSGRWLLDGKNPSDDESGFMLPSNTELTLPENPYDPLFVIEAGYTRTHGYLYFRSEQGQDVGSYRYAVDERFDPTGEAYKNKIQFPYGYHIDKFVDGEGNVWAPDLSTPPADGVYYVTVVFAPNTVTITFEGRFEQTDGSYKTEDAPIFSTDFTFDVTDFDALWLEIQAELNERKGSSHNYDAMLGNEDVSALKAAVLAILQRGSTPNGDYTESLTVSYDLNLYTLTLISKVRGEVTGTYVFKYKHGTTTMLNETTLTPATLPTLSRGYAWADEDFAFGENKDLTYESYAIVYTVSFRLTEQQAFFRMRRQAEDVFSFTYTYDDFDPATGTLTLRAKNDEALGDDAPTYTVTFEPDTGKMTLSDEVKERLGEELSKRGYTVTWPDEIEVPVNPEEGEEEQVFVPELDAITYYATFVDGDTVIAENVEFTVEGIVAPDLPVLRGYKDIAWEDYSWLFDQLNEDSSLNIVRLQKTAITYTITFKDGDDVVGDPITFDVTTQQITAPALPTYRGYTVAWGAYTLPYYTTEEPSDITVSLQKWLNTYTITFKDGSTVIGAPIAFDVTTQQITAPDLPPLRGYKDLAWSAYTLPYYTTEEPSDITVLLRKTAIEYTIVVDGTSYTVTVETAMTEQATEWETFRRHFNIAEKPAYLTDFRANGWALNGKLPTDEGFGFMLPSNPALTLPEDPATPLFVLVASYTRTHGYLTFLDEQGTVVGSHRYELGTQFDATGALYAITAPRGHHVDKFLDANGNVWAPDLSTAPEGGTYVVRVVFAPNRYTVTFYDLNGNQQAEVTFLYGRESLEGDVPVAESLLGYYVDWFYDADLDGQLDEDERITDWEFLSDLNADIDVHALAYELVRYTITFRLSDQDADVVTFTYTVEDYDATTGKLTLTAESGTTYALDFDPETGKLTLSEQIKTQLTNALPKRGYTVTWPDSLTLTAGQAANVQLRPSTMVANTYWAIFMDGDREIGRVAFDVTTLQLTPPALPDYPGYEVAWGTYTLPAYTTQVPSDITVSLNKTPITYTITFVDGDAILYAIEFTVEDMDSFVTPPVPERAGYTGAWEDFTLTASNMTVKVVWTPVAGEDTPTPDGGDSTDTPDADDSADFGWILWLIIGILIVAIVALLVIFLVLKNKNDDDDDDDNDPTPIVIVAEPEAEPVVEPEPVTKAYEPVVVKATYLGATSRAVINLCDLDSRFADGDVVTLALLQEMKLVSKKEKRLKILGAGTITKALTVEADYFSGAAAEKIRAAGGTPVYKQ